MKNLNCNFRLFLFGILIFFNANLFADHLMGGEINWKSVGKDTFDVKVIIYRDCNGKGIPTTPVAYKFLGDTTKYFLSTKFSAGLDVTPGHGCSRCQSSSCSFPYGIQRYVATARLITTNHKSTACEITLSWSECCRNGAITTGISGGFYIESKFNRCLNPTDNSPYSTVTPLSLICKDQCITFNYGMKDDDGDSLAYYISDPLSAEGKKLSYATPFTSKMPLRFSGFPNTNAGWDPPYCGGFRLDSITGDYQFKATKIDQTVFATRVEEWGKDPLGKYYKKGEMQIEMQPIIMYCKTNKIPTLSGIDGTSNTVSNFCVNQYQCFTINSYDEDLKDTVNVSWTKSIDGATFTVETKKQHPKSVFCWKPKPEHARDYPYTLLVNAIDDAHLSAAGRTTKSYQIYVHAWPEVKVEISSHQWCGGDVIFEAIPKSNIEITKYVWSLEDADHNWTRYGNKVNHHYRKPGIYKWRVDFESKWKCVRSDSGTFTMPKYLQVDLPKDTMVCVYTNLNIDAIGGEGIPPYRYVWSTKDTASSINVSIIKDTSFYVKIIDSDPCENSDTIHIIVLPTPNMPIITQSNDTLFATNTSGNYQWIEDSTNISGATNAYYKPTKFGKYKVRVTGGNGCFALTNSYAYPSGVGIENSTNQLALNIFPNPANDILNIEVATRKVAGFENLPR
ncbi:MAG: hypothetical protein NTX03_05210, partial [Bacteroidetes bacterium]|nr:hypothetical protein [Bacteroidota bacterium]